MEQYIIKGGNPLVGEVVIGGAKNAALGILAAAIMTDGECLIDNMPNVRDTNVLLQAMEGIGATIDRKGDNEVVISGKNIDSTGDLIVDNEYIRKIRASYYLIGALLGKYRKAQVVLPGGCDIGSRPIDQHIKGFRALGAEVKIEHGMIIAQAEQLVGNRIYLDVVSVGATINIMMAASLAQGNTVIRIKGVEKFHDTEYSVIPDQIEAGTFMMAAAATRGDVLIKNVIPKHLETISAKLIEIGAEIEESDDAVRVVAAQRLRHTQIKTLPYPGFPTDMQPQMAITLGLSTGTSTITESIFENRFRYVEELRRMGANIKMVEGNTAIIHGVEKYTGASVAAPDLRAGAALVIAGLAAEGYTTVTQIGYIQRGYERFDEKLRALGGLIEKVDSEKETNKFIYKTGTVN